MGWLTMKLTRGPTNELNKRVLAQEDKLTRMANLKKNAGTQTDPVEPEVEDKKALMANLK